MTSPSTPETQSSSGTSSWIFYFLLICVRVVIAPFLPGYVHPDEFFQGGQELWFGCPPSTPWEFDSKNALRSVVPPFLMTWIPLKLYAEATEKPISLLSGVEVWVLPRVFCALLSVITVDFCVWKLSVKKEGERGVPTPVLLLASAWPTFVLLSRPFSNSLETFVLAVLLGAALRPTKGYPPSLAKCIWVGMLCAMGFFTRFTFAFFGSPIMLSFLLQLEESRSDALLLIKLWVLGMSILITSLLLIFMDTDFYSDGRTGLLRPVITPWNALAYNSQIINLQEHGLHPRWTHSAVNMMMLFGPLTIWTYLSLLLPRSWMGNAATEEIQGSIQFYGTRRIRLVSLWIILLGLGVLSIAPHQEARFLLPLLIPVVLRVGNESNVLGSKLFAFVWVLFNAVCLILFGGLHQSGVVTSLLSAGESIGEHWALPRLPLGDPLQRIFFHTYMPPTFLTRKMSSSDQLGSGGYGNSCHRGVEYVDLKGGSMEELSETIFHRLQCSTMPNGIVQLFTPTVAGIVDGKEWRLSGDCTIADGYNCKLLGLFYPSLSTEDLPVWEGSIQGVLNQMELRVYEISCK